MAHKGKDEMASSGIPHPHRRVVAARGDARTIGGPRHGIHRRATILANVAIVGVFKAPCPSIPDLHISLLASGGKVLSVGKQGHGVYNVDIPRVTCVDGWA